MSADHAALPDIAVLGPATRVVVFGAAPTDVRPTTGQWGEELPLVIGERASGLAVQRMSTAGIGRDGLGNMWDALVTSNRCDSMDALAIAATTLPLLRTLAASDVPCVLIKGLAVARHYPASEMRPFRDIDIVVPIDRFEKARELARAAGLTTPPHDLQPHPSFDLRCREGINLADASGLVRLDLHHHVSPWAFSHRLHHARLHSLAEPIDIHGHRVLAAAPVHCLAVAVLHLVSEQWQKKLSLVTWSDIGVLAQVIGSTDDSARAAADELRELRLDGLVAGVLRSLPEHARPAPLQRALAHARVPLGSRLRLRALHTDSAIGRHPASWAARLPVTNSLWFLAGSAVPSRAYIRGRFGPDASYRTWWSQAISWAKQAVRGHDVSSPYSTGREQPPDAP